MPLELGGVGVFVGVCGVFVCGLRMASPWMSRARGLWMASPGRLTGISAESQSGSVQCTAAPMGNKLGPRQCHSGILRGSNPAKRALK
jgi:hypothetical protein